MADFNINLARSMVSTPEERQRFYNRMLIYLVICAAAMVYVAYLGSVNLVSVVRDHRHRRALVQAVTSASDYGKIFYKDPAKAYEELGDYANDLEILRVSVSKRAQFLPVLNQLFMDFPKKVVLQNLTARGSDKTISFGLVIPYSGQDDVDPVRALQSQWNNNAELQKLVASIRPITSEQHMVGNSAAAFVKFECILR